MSEHKNKGGRPRKARPPQVHRQCPPLANLLGQLKLASGRIDRATLGMIRQACAQEWYPFTEADRVALVDKIRELRQDVCDPKALAAVGKVQLAAEAHNLKVIELLERLLQTTKDAPAASNVNVQVNVNTDAGRDRIAAIAERLGIADVLEPARPPESDANHPAIALPAANGSAHANGANGTPG